MLGSAEPYNSTHGTSNSDSEVCLDKALEGENMRYSIRNLRQWASRRSFIKGGLGAGAATLGAGILGNGALAKGNDGKGKLSKGDAAILRFLAAAEIIESDLWVQYNELGGIRDNEVPGGSGSPLYTAALQILDGGMNQYIHDNTEDEFSHETFINAYLASKRTA